MSDTPMMGDLLSGLAQNPELLKNAMQMASALASSGALNGLLGGAGTSPSKDASPQPGGGLADLLSGLGTAVRPPAPPEPPAPPPPAGPCHADRVRLLQAICPFLPGNKREKVQTLIQLLNILHSAEQMGLGKLI